MAGRDLSKQELERIEQLVSQEVSRAFEKATSGTAMHKLGVALTLISLLDSKSLGKHQSQSLEEYDNEARDVLEMRRTAVEDVRTRWAQDPSVAKAMTAARELGLRRALGNPQVRIKAFATFLVSPEFKRIAMRRCDDDRAKVFSEKIATLTSLDPDLAQDVALIWFAWEIEEDPGRAIKQASEAEAIDALDRVLALMVALSEEDAKKSCTAPGGSHARMLPANAMHELASQASRRALATTLTKHFRTKSYLRELSNDDARLIAEANKIDPRFGRLHATLAKTQWLGRGVTSFFSLWSLAVVADSFPPVDAQGNFSKSKAAVGCSTLLSIVGTVPEMAKFADTDLAKVLGTVVTRQFRNGSAVARAGGVCKLAQGAKFVRFCGYLGPVGDVIALPISISNIIAEAKNEDSVDVVIAAASTVTAAAGLVGGILILAGSGVGLPLAVGAAVVGLVLALVDTCFGESALTGQIRQDLRMLDISTAEEQAHQKLTTDTRTVTRVYGYMGGGGMVQSTERYTISDKKVRARASTATQAEKVALINQSCEGWTDGGDETLIVQVLCDTPYDNGEFLRLVETVDMRRVARELESENEAAIVMLWTAQAYANANKTPGKPFREQLMHHANEHRDGPIRNFLKRCKDKPEGGNEMKRSIYQSIEPSLIVDACKALMAGKTYGGDESAIYELLAKCSYTQYSKVFERGGYSFVRQLKSELSSSQWQKVRSWMRNEQCSPCVRHYATMAR